MTSWIPFLLSVAAGLSTVVGASVFFFHKTISDTTLHFSLGMSAGVMLYLSFLELLPESIQHIGSVNGHMMFFLGMIIMAFIDRFFPHHILKRLTCKGKNCDQKLYGTGLIVAIGLALHNIPEGSTVFMGSYVDLSFGFLLAAAIALHNIPEGVAIAAPLIKATGSKMVGLKYALVAGFAEPAGAFISFILLKPYLQSDLVFYLFAGVAGVMVYISFDELLPICFRCKSQHISLFGIMTGMCIAFLSIFLMNG